MWITDPEVDSRLSGHVLWPLVSGSHLFGASPEVYMIWIFWEMTSGIISVCNALGSTVDTCFCQSTRLWGVSHIFYVNVNSDPEGTSWLSLSTETGFTVQTVQQTVKISQVQFLVWLSTRPLLCSDRCRGSDSTEFRGDSAVAVWGTGGRCPCYAGSQLRFIDKVFTV